MSELNTTIEQPQLEYDYTYNCSDFERGAFSLGWEYHRRGRPIDDNPFDPGSNRHAWFQDGWEKFADTLLRQNRENQKKAGL